MRGVINLTCGIYKIENLTNGKIYIGQSVEIEQRWKKHLIAKDDFAIHQAIRKYGKNNFTFSIVEECKAELLNERECYWINYYNSIVPNGYNMIIGGSNGAGIAKGLKVIQYSLSGDYINEFESAQQASNLTGIDHWSICACCRKEYKHSGGFQWRYASDKEEVKSLSIRTNFTVLQINKETNEIIAEFSSLAEASKFTGIASSTICNVCKGKGKTAGGFKWQYKNN